jgi:hypothetical protein
VLLADAETVGMSRRGYTTVGRSGAVVSPWTRCLRVSSIGKVTARRMKPLDQPQNAVKWGIVWDRQCVDDDATPTAAIPAPRL